MGRPKLKEPNSRIDFRLSPKTFKKIEEIAKDKDLLVTAVVRMMIADYFKKLELNK